jgi:hypothetical protein
LARGPRKPKFGKNRSRLPKHNEKNRGGRKRRLLDMRRRKYFRMDLDEMLDGFGLGENAGTVSATIQNKLMTQSLDDAVEYVKRIKEENNLAEEKIDGLVRLMERYTKWR